MTDDPRRTMNDDGRQPIAIGHLSDSGDLIKSLEILYTLDLTFCNSILYPFYPERSGLKIIDGIVGSFIPLNKDFYSISIYGIS